MRVRAPWSGARRRRTKTKRIHRESSLYMPSFYGREVCELCDVGHPPTPRPESATDAPMSRLVWQYEGGAEGTPVEQCALVGDKVLDDVLGEGTAVRIDGRRHDHHRVHGGG